MFLITQLFTLLKASQSQEIDEMVENWRNIAVKPSSSIRDTWKELDRGALRFVVVVDENDRLLGVVTDGDIRRSLLGGRELSDKIEHVMNRKPKVASSKLSKADLIDLMEKHGVLALPLVDEGRVVGVVELQKLLQVPPVENPVFIMAGGFGTRLRPLTDKCPKPMLQVGGRPLLETLVRSFKRKGFRNFYVSTHYLPEVIRDHFGDGSSLGVSISYVHEEQPLGTGGALGLLPAAMPDLPLVMINGDILTSVDFRALLDFHVKHETDATICVRSHEITIPYGVVEGEGVKIDSMVEKPTYRYFVNTGIYVVSPKIYRGVMAGTRIDMPTLLQARMREGLNVKKIPSHEYWLDVGRMDDFQRAQQDIHVLGLL